MPEAVSAFGVELPGHPRCFRAFVPLSADSLAPDANSGWAHVAMLGTWEGHSAGKFEFTRETFRQILANFRRQKNPIPYDYEHDTFDGSKTGPKPASGWVRMLELRNQGSELWAYVDWTPRAAEMIRAGEYRFCSPVVDLESRSRETNEDVGAELLSVALTNNPFLDGQHPLKLTMVAAGAASGASPTVRPATQSFGDVVERALPGEASPPTASHQPPTSLAEAPPVAQPSADLLTPPSAAQVEDVAPADIDAVDASALLKALADGAGIDKAQALAALFDMQDKLIELLQDTIDIDGTPAELRAMSNKPVTPPVTTPTTEPVTPPATPPVVAPPTAAPPATAPAADVSDDVRLAAIERERDKETIATLSARLEVIEAERAAEKKAAIAALVDSKIADGYIQPAARDAAIWAFTANRARAEEIYASKIVPVGTRQSTQPASSAVASSEHPTNPGAPAGAVDLSQFSRQEQAEIQCLMGARKTQRQAADIILARRNARATN